MLALVVDHCSRSVFCTHVARTISHYRVDKESKPIRCLNLGSYNYLGFADDWAESCQKEVVGSLDNFEVSMASSRADMGESSTSGPRS